MGGEMGRWHMRLVVSFNIGFCLLALMNEVLYFLNVFGVEGNHVLDQILLNVELEGKLLCLGVDVVL